MRVPGGLGSLFVAGLCLLFPGRRGGRLGPWFLNTNTEDVGSVGFGPNGEKQWLVVNASQLLSF